MAGKPVCPPHVASDAVAREFWDWLMEQLGTMRILSAADRAVCELAATDYSTLRRNQNAIAIEGEVITAATGTLQSNPRNGIVGQCRRRLASLLSEMGLTVTARTRIKISVQRPKDRLAEFAARGRA